MAFSTGHARLAAHNYAMPAMSPTMTEGGIVEWKFKEGDSFSAGDVLLEIETDKAQIDVEAQDDGVIAKIYAHDGEKGIAVGKTIAALAEPGDDVSSLSLPEPESDLSSGSESSESKSGSQPQQTESKPSKPEPQSDKKSPVSQATGSNKPNPDQTLLPSVQKILKQNDISTEKALQEIKATGPKGRILKGDVLAYVGTVSDESIAKINNEIKKLQSLDLSNIKPASKKDLAAPAKESSQTQDQVPKKEEKPKPVPITGVFTLIEIQELAHEFGDSIGGAPIPVENIVDRAVKLALKDVPQYSMPKPSVLRDPVFELLLDFSPRQKPFEYKLIYPQKLGNPSSGSSIYDVLSSKSKPLHRPQRSARVTSKELLTVQVTLNEKVKSSSVKAQAFLDRLGYYLGEGRANLFV